MKTNTIRVSTQAYLREGREGWLVRWSDAAGILRRYFVLSRDHAKQTRARAKEGKLPKCWAVKA